MKNRTPMRVILQNIVQTIQRGRFNVGDTIMSERVMAEISGHSRNTVREAMIFLEDRGIITRVWGKETRLANDPLSSEEHY